MACQSQNHNLASILLIEDTLPYDVSGEDKPKTDWPTVRIYAPDDALLL